MPKDEKGITLLNNLGSKRSLVMKFGQFVYYMKMWPGN